MPDQTITIAVPQETYEPLRDYAERARRSVEEAVLEMMQAALTDGERTIGDRQAILEALALLDTAALWQLVQRNAENEEVLLLVALNEKREQQGLTEAEERVVRDLIRHHDRTVLIRAKALALLRQRGEDVSALVNNT